HTGQNRLYGYISGEEKIQKYNIYKKYRVIIGVSESVAKSFSDVFPDLSPEVLYNPFNLKTIRKKADEKVEHFKSENVLQLITVGRLIKVKGYDRLLRALSRCKEAGHRFHLMMIGEGSEAESLKMLVNDLGLTQNVFF